MNKPTTIEREKDTGCCGAAPCSASLSDTPTWDALYGDAMQEVEVQERLIMVKAPDNHIVGKYDSIDEPCLSHRGLVSAPRLAVNVPGAVGKRAGEYNALGRQVWTGRMMLVKGGKIIARTMTPNAPHERGRTKDVN